MTTKVAVIGATGKMGQLVSRIVEASDEFELFAQLDSKAELSEMLGADVAVDVTLPAVSQSVVEFAAGHGINVLVGTSGWSGERIAQLELVMAGNPVGGVVIVPNFSIGSILATRFAAIAAPYFDSIEIVEAHQATKVDSPSGTAVRTAELMGEARSSLGPVVAPHVDQRARGEQVSSIPIHSLRMAGLLARQEVILGGTGELLTIKHEILDPNAYEAGILLALRAVRSTRGLVVGLDQVMDLAAPEASPEPESEPVE